MRGTVRRREGERGTDIIKAGERETDNRKEREGGKVKKRQRDRRVQLIGPGTSCLASSSHGKVVHRESS